MPAVEPLSAATRPLRVSDGERMFCPMERRHEWESIRRSIAMLNPGDQALRREEAMGLLRELQDLESRLRRMRAGLLKVIEEDGPGAG